MHPSASVAAWGLLFQGPRIQFF